MKFEFNWPSGFWENYVLIYWLDSKAERSKVNLWNLFIATDSLDLTYQVRIMTLASTAFKKSTFIFFQFKCIRKQILPWCEVGQGQPRIIIWTNLVGPTSQMLHTKSQGHRPPGSGVVDL